MAEERAERSDHCVMDATTQTLRCERCGEEVPIPVGVIDWFVGVTRAFSAAHADCEPRLVGGPDERKRTGFSTPVGTGAVSGVQGSAGGQ